MRLCDFIIHLYVLRKPNCNHFSEYFLISVEMAPVRRSARNSKTRTNSPKKQNSLLIGAKRRANRKNKFTSSKDEVIREKSPTLELNSSPIKQSDGLQVATPTKQKHVFKKSKSVLFSDDLVSDSPSTPERCNSPIRSILKPSNENTLNGASNPNNTSFWDDSNQAKPNNPKSFEFWLPGTIIQLPSGSERLPILVEGCMSVLSDEMFERRFEVYATLNSIFKSNLSTTLIKLFVNLGDGNDIENKQQRTLPIVSQIIKDIDKIKGEIFNAELDKENVSPAKGDPFKIRIVTQALRLLCLFVSSTELNDCVSNEDIYWIYDHSCMMLSNPNISKTLVSPYLSIIKDCKLSPSRKRDLFGNYKILEKLLFAILNVNSFPSSSLVTERLSCLKNYISNFPDFMSKNIGHWFEPLLLNLCNMIHPVYMKCLGIGVHCLLEAAKCFLDCRPIHMYVLNKLSSQITDEVKSFTSDQEFSGYLNQLRLQNVRLSEFVVCKLEELIGADQQKLAMDMWMGLTLLAGQDTFDRWTDLNLWIKVPNCCFSLGPQATSIALSCWRAVCFNLCKNGLDGFRKCIDCVQAHASEEDSLVAATHALKSKVKVLTHVFNSFPLVDLSKDVVDSLHNIFLINIYVILGPTILQLWAKYLPSLWDRIIQPILSKFYLKKEAGPYANQLGWEVLNTILRVSMPHPEKDFNEVRILSNDPINLTQINPTPARYVHTHFDKVMQNIIMLLLLDSIKFEQKLSLFTAFLNKIKPLVKKERKPSAATYDFVDNLPLLLKKLLENRLVSSEALVRVIVVMHNSFNPSLLISRDLGCEKNDSNINVYMPVIEISITLPFEGRSAVLKLILQSLNQTNALILITDVLQLTTIPNDTIQIFTDFLNKSNIVMSTIDLQFYGIICKYVSCNYEVFVKKVIQSIVSIPNSEEICRCLSLLHIDEWNTNVSDYVLLLLRNAPSKSIHHFVAGIISRRLETSLVQILGFVTKNDFASEMFLISGNLFDMILKDRLVLSECCFLLEQYLRLKCLQGGNDYMLIDILGAGCSKYLRMDITFMKELVDFSHLPLCSREVQIRKTGLSTAVLSDSTILTCQQGNSNEISSLTGIIDTKEQSSSVVESPHLSVLEEFVSSYSNEGKERLQTSEFVGNVEGTGVLGEKNVGNSMAIENYIDGEKNMVLGSQSQSNELQLADLTFDQNMHNGINETNDEQVPLMDAVPAKVNEAGPASLLTAVDLLRLLIEKSDQELNMFSPEQKYEMESNLLQFMVKLRQLQ